MKLKDLTGQKINKLTIIKRVANSKWNETRWLCNCECGNQTILTYGKIAYGRTKSCGCYLKEATSNLNKKHGLRNHRLYNILANMKQRCYNENSKAYKNYGGRGIKICDEWLAKEDGFMNFYNWAINNGYNGDLSIDRIDNDGNYEPQNCRWVNNSIQSNNRRNNHKLTFNGDTLNISEWAEKYNLTISAIIHRLDRGWSIEKTLTTPLKK